tara:strand:+ start:2444 stop:3472 length:1029 start_codon:yes stop_codon:yes gene_type:complete
MGTFGSGERYDDNPFVFFVSDEYIVDPQQRQEMPNPLRAMYEDLAPLLLRSPPSKRYPQQPTGMKEWDILTDPISELVFTSAVPDPVIGQTLQRVMRPTVEGKEGLATHLNILVDCSGSMGDGYIYGVTKSGFPLAGYHVAQICTAMMIAQAAISKDSFAVWGFNRGGFPVWPGGTNQPAQNHKEAIDFFLAQVPNGESPFPARNSTNLANGLNKVGEDLRDYDFDQSVTVAIMDGSWGSVSSVNADIFANNEFNDEDLRKQGPLFYVIIGSPYDQDTLDTTVRVFREALTKHYGQDMSGCVLDFALVIGEDGNMEDVGGALVQMAQINAGIATDLKPCPRI